MRIWPTRVPILAVGSPAVSDAALERQAHHRSMQFDLGSIAYCGATRKMRIGDGYGRASSVVRFMKHEERRPTAARAREARRFEDRGVYPYYPGRRIAG